MIPISPNKHTGCRRAQPGNTILRTKPRKKDVENSKSPGPVNRNAPRSSAIHANHIIDINNRLRKRSRRTQLKCSNPHRTSPNRNRRA